MLKFLIFLIGHFPAIGTFKQKGVSPMKTLSEILRENPTLVVTRVACPYCDKAKDALKSREIDFLEMAVEKYPELAKEITMKEKHKTFPMVYLDGKFVGGCEELLEYFADENKRNERGI